MYLESTGLELEWKKTGKLDLLATSADTAQVNKRKEWARRSIRDLYVISE